MPNRPDPFSPSSEVIAHDAQLDGPYEVLLERLARGVYAEGLDFPGAQEIADEFGVSVQTAEGLISGLADQGYLAIVDGKVLFSRSSLPEYDLATQSDGASTLGHSKVNRKSSLPVYEQVYRALKRRIAEAHYDEVAFPTLAEAASEFGVSRISVKSAYQKLSKESLIDLSRGRRPSIAKRQYSSRVNTDISNLLTELRELDLSTVVSVVDHRRGEAGAEFAKALDCSPDTMIECTTRLRTVDQIPFSLVDIGMTADISLKFNAIQFDRPMSMDLMQGAGLKLTRVTENVTAWNAHGQIAKHLEIKHASAVLKVVRVFHASERGPVICSIGYYRPDQFSYKPTEPRPTKIRIE